MNNNILKFLTILILFYIPNKIFAEEIWIESFQIPDKGIWGNEDGITIHNDFDGINWSLKYENITFADADDYAKTVSTGGGRFEVRDIDGEVVWLSPQVDISQFKNIRIQLIAYETGSGSNEEVKYLKAFYKLNSGSEILFETNGINAGNWGSNVAEQSGLEGDTIQVIVYMANNYSSDKVTLDEVIISGENKVVIPPVIPFDIVINEIMADPNPVVGLPEEEYIELYNRSVNQVNLNGWSLKVRDTEKLLGNSILLPDDFLILCSTGAKDTLSGYGNCLAVPGFPSLINSGASIQLKNKEGEIIDEVKYNDNWYLDENKDNGGWSLERIDPNRFCGQSQNWIASVAEKGGTPGGENSVRANNPDLENPFLIWATATSSTQIEVMFSENMEATTLTQLSNYVVSDGFGIPNEIITFENKKIILIFSNQFPEDKKYTLELKNLNDECGNLLTETTTEIQWNKIKPGDIVINEVLFNPYPDGSDFVELVNVSQKVIPLNKLSLAAKDEKLELKQVYALTEDKITFTPGSYLLCTPEIAGVTNFYYSECPECFLEMDHFPTYPNEEGYIVLLTDSTEVIDEFLYNEKMHSEILYDEEGVSLERVTFTSETNQNASWHSASENVGFATPGYKNSQYSEEGITNYLVLETESFSPNNDGYNDKMILNYQLEESGYIANVWIFNSNGQLITQLMKNQIMGTVGTIEWNGENGSGQRQPMGAYVISVEIFNLEGLVEKFKDVCILTDILK